MDTEQKDDSLATLQEIRSIMERSARFLSLSGWSGIWAGMVALAGAGIAYKWFEGYKVKALSVEGFDNAYTDMIASRVDHPKELIGLGLVIFIVALIGGFYFTYRKNKKAGVPIWNQASRKMLINLFIPLAAGAVIILAFIVHGHWIYISPACLIFYGLALINGSKYTVSDIKYLGLAEMILGCIGLFIEPGYGLLLWALGFGVLHIVYGIIMWRKYDQ